jgi:D-glycero-D-manno-heptose 1,7-bisphosphate phosphatase
MRADRAVFLDKDGTLVDDVPYNVDPDLVRLAPGAEEGLPALRDQGYRLFVVSNQSGVAHGLFPESALVAVERRLRELLGSLGVALDDFLYCPHHPDGRVRPYAIDCHCRKPASGLIRRASDTHRLDLARSWLIGDILDDVEAARRSGCQTILIDNGHETEWRAGTDREPHHKAADLAEAARVIAEADRNRHEARP